MDRKTITANDIETIAWYDNTIIDWANAGRRYSPDGNIKHSKVYVYQLERS